MMGITGLRMIYKDSNKSAEVPMNTFKMLFPYKTTVTSQQMVNPLGQPTYRRDGKA